ncbi:MAG: hypothetical protein A3F94_02080 [Candidatus Spechtbacteria bacterium RIFCSPLOWO2_12_FULL_38_22]|uniref:Uncharacterized protein n=1 Tax=Candidatus Spechtbacteria bacterium RIFCSPLOWO2_12_FULL_38_22 TaxID=1802165 RepID=A0A1G2HHY7_9BACT|nr:MAG: hypothetical protein A2728_00610 [Candidatus Spechtbacteria bacterium RIFCSPHIGHO2_01_FULL_38_11]OGZ59799.1 MAG: hypothetical protein A3E58_00905 [Candidatus Spechtbacteria bacterium RIFCSPHIGHO2_12_FULL_38_30]OGZ60001.1 MAG: hypothetical protein A3A00_01375 [Candidatus Spechtbacteria bacterium RIFCSPLOWO2_01_FULL_38_20]OGZ62114.1 MAG: hypothetical protein A3F94_02080 [Candidatus Spechtbacteria bacterium RIFCSPLOWO2_12_FULL_38_22]
MGIAKGLVEYQVLKKIFPIFPTDGFAYFSGQSIENQGWFPCLYFYWNNGGVWVVSGPPNIKIETKSFRKAVREYKKHFVGKSTAQVGAAVVGGISLCRCHKSS